MQLTLNGTPIAVDPIAAEEIVRRHLLRLDDIPFSDRDALALIQQPALPAIRKGEKPIGFYSDAEGKLIAVILLPGEKNNINWKDALAWAKDQGGDLPSRVEALLLFQHHRDEFQREVYWTNEQRADDSSFAWGQSFDYGYQSDWPQGIKSMARAVRRVAI